MEDGELLIEFFNNYEKHLKNLSKEISKSKNYKIIFSKYFKKLSESTFVVLFAYNLIEDIVLNMIKENKSEDTDLNILINEISLIETYLKNILNIQIEINKQYS